ncbi:hypothetical protein [Oceanobacillus sojae]|uniref:hypothetical protein n=1 Tax=Oceanobacillus sojae TaxID=582851 RepID=UPI00362A7AD7
MNILIKKACLVNRLKMEQYILTPFNPAALLWHWSGGKKGTAFAKLYLTTNYKGV